MNCDQTIFETVLPINKLTPWMKDIPEKLKDTQLVKKLPTFSGIRKFFIVFTRGRPGPILS
jgi:hypothetical protein